MARSRQHWACQSVRLCSTISKLSALTNTCVKLIPLSQTDGARLVASFRKRYSTYIDMALAADADDLCLSSPGLDIRAMQHEVLYSRLYMS